MQPGGIGRHLLRPPQPGPQRLQSAQRVPQTAQHYQPLPSLRVPEELLRLLISSWFTGSAPNKAMTVPRSAAPTRPTAPP